MSYGDIMMNSTPASSSTQGVGTTAGIQYTPHMVEGANASGDENNRKSVPGDRTVCTWLNGEETSFPGTFSTVGDLRLELCRLRDAVWRDVYIMDAQCDMLSDSSEDAPSRLTCVVHRDRTYSATEWKECMMEHVSRNDAAGVNRCISRMTGDTSMDIKSVISYVWFQSIQDMTRINMLLSAGVDVNTRGEYDALALHEATLQGLDDLVALLISQGADVNAQDSCGNSPLQLAAFKNHYSIAVVLVRAGASATKCDEDGLTALHWAARTDTPCGQMTEMLLAAGSDPNAETRRGLVPLHWASAFGHRRVVILLLEAGADANAQSRCGNTALHWTLGFRSSHQEVVESLVEYGADLNICNRRGEKPQPPTAGWSRGRWRNVTLLEGVNTLIRAGGPSVDMIDDDDLHSSDED